MFVGTFDNAYRGEERIRDFADKGVLQQLYSAKTRSQAEKTAKKTAREFRLPLSSVYIIRVTDTNRYLVYI